MPNSHSARHTLLRTPSRLLLPALAGLLACLLWTHAHPHSGMVHLVAAATHRHLRPSQAELLASLFTSAAIGVLGARWLAWRAAPVPRPQPASQEDLLAAASFGAYAANRSARRFPSPSGRSWIAYRAAGPILVALGGATGEPAELGDLRRRFGRWAGPRPVVWYGTARAGVAIGEEAIVRLPHFGLGGHRMANLRHSMSRAARAGIEIRFADWQRLSAEQRAQVEALDSNWHRRHRLPVRLTLSSLRDARDGRLWALAVRDGRVEGFVTWLDTGDGQGLVLDLMRRRPDAVPGAMEAVIHDSLVRARERGLRWASLGVCPGAEPRGRLTAAAAGGLNPPSLRRFKDKFAPEWHERRITAPTLPRAVALAASAWVHVAP